MGVGLIDFSYSPLLLSVIGAIAATLYPLWPESSRVIIYYLSWIGMVVVVALLVLYVGEFVCVCVCV